MVAPPFYWENYLDLENVHLYIYSMQQTVMICLREKKEQESSNSGILYTSTYYTVLVVVRTS